MYKTLSKNRNRDRNRNRNKHGKLSYDMHENYCGSIILIIKITGEIFIYGCFSQLLSCIQSMQMEVTLLSEYNNVP